MLRDPTHTELLFEEKRSPRLKVLAFLSAFLVTAIVFGGYTYLRRRTAQQRLATIAVPAAATDAPRGPAKAHILVDEALLQGKQTILGGTVKNVSTENLNGLTVAMELRRKDGSLEQASATVEPNILEPAQEGRYSLTLPVQQYITARLAGLKAGEDSTLLVYTSAPGKKRPPMAKFEPKGETGPRSGSKDDGFLNSPDNPARVP